MECGYIQYAGKIGQPLVLSIVRAKDVEPETSGYGHNGELPIKARTKTTMQRIFISPLRLKQKPSLDIDHADNIVATIWFENNLQDRHEELIAFLRDELYARITNLEKSVRSLNT